MSDYLLLVREDETAHASQSPAAIAELIARRARFADELRRADRLKDCGRFRPSAEGKRVRRAGDKVIVDAGPFVDDGAPDRGGPSLDARVDEVAPDRGGPSLDARADDRRPIDDSTIAARDRVDDTTVATHAVGDDDRSKDDKAIAAYYWIDAPTLDEATRLADELPMLPADEIDVRPLMKGKAHADMQAKPGKIFAFAVLGNAGTEEAWSDVMDRIDAETHDRFPADAFLGGNRLQPPRTGRRVATRGERRAVFDGPFLESKEVIGGVFFLRMMTIDEAVSWAASSRFVVHGALEIRELWRS